MSLKAARTGSSAAEMAKQLKSRLVDSLLPGDTPFAAESLASTAEFVISAAARDVAAEQLGSNDRRDARRCVF